MPVRDSKVLTIKGAHMVRDAAIAKAQEFGSAVTVAVVDAGGHLLVLERMEGGRFHTVHTSTAKAVTAASNRRRTGSRGAQGQPLDVIHAVGLSLAAGQGNWTAMEGGVPIFFGAECVGAVGVAGGSWEQDETIARFAVAAIGAKEEASL